MQPLELQHLAGPAARGGGDPVSGSVEQHGQPAAVLLLYKDIQGKHEGSPLLTAVQQRRVHQIGEHETEEHQLSEAANNVPHKSFELDFVLSTPVEI